MKMKLNKIYENLILKNEQEGYNIADKKSKEIYKQQKKDREDLLNKVAKVLLTYTILDTVLSLKDREKNKLNNEFKLLIDSMFKGQYKQEKIIYKDIFSNVIKNKYYKNAYIMNLGINFNLKKLSDEEIDKIVNGKIDNIIWSNRLWNNKNQLEKDLQKEISNFLKGKTTVNDINKRIKNKFNSNAYNTHRLVQTEVARCQNNVNNVFAEKHGIEEQLFCATLDNKTSNFCREHDGKIYKINDSNKPSLPSHPFCRSCYINVPFKDWKPKVRKNNENKDIIDYEDYNKWLKNKSAELKS